MIRCGLIGLVCAALYLIIDAGVASAQVTILTTVQTIKPDGAVAVVVDQLKLDQQCRRA